MSLQERLITQMGTNTPMRNEILEVDKHTGEITSIINDPVVDVVPAFAITLEEARNRVTMMQEFVKDMMVPGQDYGIIPGCPKPTLFKSGAEKLTDIFGFSKQVTVLNRVEDWKEGLFSYEVKICLVSKRTGLIEAEGIGSCNNREKKYRNQDSYTVANTILKMAKKRALIDAVLSATRSSGLFTQDIEDMDLSDNKSLQPPIDITQSVGRTKPKQPPKTDPGATAPQLKKIYALANEIGLYGENARAFLMELYGVDNSNELTKRQASDFIEKLLELKG